VITGISTEILELPKIKDSMRIISPVSHGTGFIALYDVFKDGANIQNYIAKDYIPDTLTYFISLMSLNKIKLTEVNKVKYHFLQIPGWAFTVDYFNRKELNSGWLISELKRMSNNEKRAYKKEILKINFTDIKRDN
jgi:serine/threonine protein kinase